MNLAPSALWTVPRHCTGGALLEPQPFPPHPPPPCSGTPLGLSAMVRNRVVWAGMGEGWRGRSLQAALGARHTAGDTQQSHLQHLKPRTSHRRGPRQRLHTRLSRGEHLPGQVHLLPQLLDFPLLHDTCSGMTLSAIHDDSSLPNISAPHLPLRRQIGNPTRPLQSNVRQLWEVQFISAINLGMPTRRPTQGLSGKSLCGSQIGNLDNFLGE